VLSRPPRPRLQIPSCHPKRPPTSRAEKSLGEVVVIGYGSQKKKIVTAAVDQISGKEIAKRPVANVIQGLQGVSPGLNISYPGGKPGALPDINIRGMGTVTGGGTPLIIIDGVAAIMPNVTFIKINRDFFIDLAKTFNITSIPTLVFLKDGKEIGRYDGGPLNQDKLANLITKVYRNV
jgi:hypothetical protein